MRLQLQEPNQSRPDLQTLYNSPYQMTQGYGCYDIDIDIDIEWAKDRTVNPRKTFYTDD